MSRGDRAPSSGNISKSMRNNYAELGVDEYYRQVGTTYRNPHFPGIRQCLYLWFNRWWQMECANAHPDSITLFDMACGSGEATLSFIEWWQTGQKLYKQSQVPESQAPQASEGTGPPTPRRNVPLPIPLNPDAIKPSIIAADPYTSQAFNARTAMHAASLSFREIAEGALPEIVSRLTLLDPDVKTTVGVGSPVSLEMVVCSFALHLVANASELFALLWELSTKTRWLIVLAPHKKPEIKDGWGWTRWDVEQWSRCEMNASKGDYLKDRVHCRVYRSTNTL